MEPSLMLRITPIVSPSPTWITWHILITLTWESFSTRQLSYINVLHDSTFVPTLVTLQPAFQMCREYELNPPTTK